MSRITSYEINERVLTLHFDKHTSDTRIEAIGQVFTMRDKEENTLYIHGYNGSRLATGYGEPTLIEKIRRELLGLM